MFASLMLCIMLGMLTITAGAASANLLSSAAATFETSDIPEDWGALYKKGTLSVSSDEAHSGSKSLLLDERSASYNSPAYSIYNIFKTNGAGTYTISLWAYADGLMASTTAQIVLRCGSEDYTFITDATNKRALVVKSTIDADLTWTKLSGTITVDESDIAAESDESMFLCLDGISANATALYIDDVEIVKGVVSGDVTAAPNATAPSSSENTADAATLGYSIASVVGLLGIAAGKKGFRK